MWTGNCHQFAVVLELQIVFFLPKQWFHSPRKQKKKNKFLSFNYNWKVEIFWSIYFESIVVNLIKFCFPHFELLKNEMLRTAQYIPSSTNPKNLKHIKPKNDNTQISQLNKQLRILKFTTHGVSIIIQHPNHNIRM